MAFVSSVVVKGRSRVVCGAEQCGRELDRAEVASRRDVLLGIAGGLAAIGFHGVAPAFAARPEGVNRPELLPKTYSTVIVRLPRPWPQLPLFRFPPPAILSSRLPPFFECQLQQLF